MFSACRVFINWKKRRKQKCVRYVSKFVELIKLPFKNCLQWCYPTRAWSNVWQCLNVNRFFLNFCSIKNRFNRRDKSLAKKIPTQSLCLCQSSLTFCGMRKRVCSFDKVCVIEWEWVWVWVSVYCDCVHACECNNTQKNTTMHVGAQDVTCDCAASRRLYSPSSSSSSPTLL